MSKIEIPSWVPRKDTTEYQVWTLVDDIGEQMAMAFSEDKFHERLPPEKELKDEGFSVHNRNWVTEAQLNNPFWRAAVGFIL